MDSRLRFLLIAIGVGLLLYFFFFRHDERPSSATRPLPLAPTAAERGSEHWVPIRANGLSAWVSTYSGTLRNIRLTTPQFRGEMVSTVNTSDPEASRAAEAYRPGHSNVTFVREGRNVLPTYLTYRVERSNEREVVLVAEPPGSEVTIRRTIRAHPSAQYTFLVNTEVINHGAPGRVGYAEGVGHWVRRDEESGGLFRQSWRLSEGMCYRADGRLLRESREEIGKRGDNDNVASRARWTGLGNLYFLQAVVAQDPVPTACHLRSEDRYSRESGSEPSGSIMYARLSWPTTQLMQGQSQSFHALEYYGPKLSSALRAADPTLTEAVNLGFFAIIARGLLKLLQLLYALVHNWGVAIILLTVIVRLALFPILARSTKSMAMMQKLKPELDIINEKYKDDPNQKGLATMELYRKHKINPLSGCLPQLAQLPIWWALYTTLQTSVELYHAPFGPWKDLSAADPYFVLPLVLGLVMFLQQKLMPPAMPDPVQAKIMLYFMPIFLTAISLFLPAGLALYMLVNSLLGIIQQRITKAQIDRMTLAASGGIEVRPIAPEQTPPSKGGKNNTSGGRRDKQK